MACTYLKILRKKFAILEKTSRKQNLTKTQFLRIVFFTETHLNNQITDDDIAISGFDVPFRKDRNSHGGGIIMYHKSNINILRITCMFIKMCWFVNYIKKTVDHDNIIYCCR
jgi:hypothetical protein